MRSPRLLFPFAAALAVVSAAPGASAADAGEAGQPTPATSASPPPRDLYVAAATGVALLPVGPSRQMTLLPIGLEAGVRWSRALDVGGLAEFAPSVGGDCEPRNPYETSRCAGFRAKLAMRARVHFARDRGADPWVAAGFGLDLLSAPGFADDASHAPIWGASLPHLDLGLDLRLSDAVVVTPYAGAELGIWAGTLANRAAPRWAGAMPWWSVAAGARVGTWL